MLRPLVGLCALIVAGDAGSARRSLRWQSRRTSSNTSFYSQTGLNASFSNSQRDAFADASRSEGEFGAGDNEDGEPSPCTCECCQAQRGRETLVSRTGLECMPRVGAGVAGGADGEGDGGCDPQCAVSEDQAKAFDSKGDSVDYARYCNSECEPGGSTLNALCVDLGSFDDGASDASASGNGVAVADVGAASVAPAAPNFQVAPVDQAMTQVQSQVGNGAVYTAEQAPGGGISLPMAKGDMVQAMMHAKAAGEAARIAKETYEQVLAAPRKAAEDAGKAAMDEVKREAGEQAKETLLIRLSYEEKAQAKATKNALAVAMRYHNALGRDAGLAGDWAQRSQEYASAAGERKANAMYEAGLATKYKSLSEWDLSREYILAAHQSMDSAAAYAKSAAAAHHQAVEINKGLKWFIYAEQAGAANMLAKSMPPDVPPPDMPPLP